MRAGDSGAMNWGRTEAAPADRGVKVLGYREEAWLFILCMQSLEIPGPYDVIRLSCIFVVLLGQPCICSHPGMLLGWLVHRASSVV